jgi:4-amino-4-deoxy-L-arabinose transferase-like glycosyltransferase
MNDQAAAAANTAHASAPALPGGAAVPAPQRVTWRDHALGAALAVAYVAVLLATAPALGLSRDEGIYVVAAESYARWFELLASDPSQALKPEVIDRFWSMNHEHPALMKSLFAWSYLLDQKVSLFTRDSLAFRFPGMLSAGLLVWLILVFGTRLYGRRAGLFAALAYALLPRPFYHSHLDAFDVPIAFMVTLVTYAYWRSLSERRWALWCGVAFGLALATKHNSWFLPGIFALHFAYARWLEHRRARATGAAVASRVPYWLGAMLLLGPPIFFASWPWLWHDTAARVREYFVFHLHHPYYNMEYFGVNYFWPPFPASYAFVMTLYTVPVTTLLLAFVGLGWLGRREWSSLRAAFAHGTTSACAPAPRDPQHTTVLLLGSVLAPLVVFLVPSTPIFGGTKHWFTAYPFLALFAGVGFDSALSVYASWVPERLARMRRALAFPLGALLLLPALVETAHSHPFGLSHYGFAAGFVPGAADRGMNRQFWGFTTRSLVDFFDAHLPHGGRVYACDTLDVSFRMLARDGFLSERIVPTGDIASADYALVHHEKHFAEVDHQIWSTYGTTRPVYVLTYDGVPIISVYENPKRRAHESPQRRGVR